MPITEKSGQVRGGALKIKEKRKWRLLDVLVYGTMIMISLPDMLKRDAEVSAFYAETLITVYCYGYDLMENEMKSYEDVEAKTEVLAIDPPTDVSNCFEIKHAEEPGPDDRMFVQSCDNSTQHSIDWDGYQQAADPTRNNNITMYENVSIFMFRVLHNLALYEDENAEKIVSSEDIAMAKKAMLDMNVFVASI